MKVFICWSDERSKALASGLYDFLSDVIQQVEPFMSENDIKAGSDWANVLHTQLKDTQFGILCLTPENLNSRWIHYEAGALSKALNDDASLVCPCLYKVSPSQVEWPLARFQGKECNKDGIRNIIEALNASLDQPLPDEKLTKAFDKFYPDLKKVIEKIPDEHEGEEPPQRGDRELLEEILQLVREQTLPRKRISLSPLNALLGIHRTLPELIGQIRVGLQEIRHGGIDASHKLRQLSDDLSMISKADLIPASLRSDMLSIAHTIDDLSSQDVDVILQARRIRELDLPLISLEKQLRHLYATPVLAHTTDAFLSDAK